MLSTSYDTHDSPEATHVLSKQREAGLSEWTNTDLYPDTTYFDVLSHCFFYYGFTRSILIIAAILGFFMNTV